MKFRYYILQRLFMIIPTFIIVSFLMYYFLVAFSHGEPVVLYFHNEIDAVYYGTHPKELAALRAAHGFDKPWYIQWILYVARILTGDWGYSPKYNDEIVHVVARALPATLEFVFFGILLALVIGIPYGIKSSIAQPKQNFYIYGTSLIGISAPVFVFALFIKALILETFFYVGFSSNEKSVVTFGFYDGQFNPHYFTYPTHIIFGLPPTGFLLIDSLLSFNILWLS